MIAMTSFFDWKRFWCLRGESINLGDRGFLSDPEDKWGKYANPALVTFADLAELPCVALLGEPGIGKSWTLRCQSPEIQGSLPAGARLMCLDLRSFGDESRLMASLFESEVFEDWRKGDWFLHVFLDSLDECLLRIDHVATLLADELPKQPVERLRLRIACRTVPWPTILEKALAGLFGECRAYEMAPLRRIDVQRAAERSGIPDAAALLHRIDELDVSSLAIKPVTLKFLISTYLREGDFPKSLIELYEKGCRILCEESNESRRSAGRRGRLKPEERLAIASRIAAVTQLGKRFAVYTGSEADGVPLEDVMANDLSGGVERTIDEISVSMDTLWEVLDTGLFSSRGSNRIGWAHQTYAEFLTARYCKRRGMPIEQIRSLIFHPADQGRSLIPQLHEVAAWMSAIDPEILKVVANSDPEALLGAAAAGLSDDQRYLVVDSMLQQASEGRTLHLRWGLIWLYQKLKHSQLPNQLRPYLRDGSKLLGARLVAVSIARACQVEELGPDLADIALDPLADAGLRNSSAAAAAAMGSREVRARLRPLAFGEAGEDPDDELKGSGLRSIWPDFITATELFPLLTAPKRQGLSGTYTAFLYDHVIEKMAVRDIPVALDWFSKQEHRQRLLGAMDRLMDRIVQLAWDSMDEPAIASGLATATVSRLRLYDSIISGDDGRAFADKVNANLERRRKLLTALLPLLSVDGVSRLYISNVPLVTPSDFEWMIDRALRAGTQEAALVDARLVRFAFDPRDTKAVEKLWSACRANAILNAECGNFFAPIFLDSEEAKMLREQWRQEKEWKTPKLLQPAPSERIESDLLKIETGNMGSWVQLTLDLTLEPTSASYDDRAGPNLTETPGWKAADSLTRERILDAALRYIQEGDPQNDEWFRTSSIFYTAIGGFHALALLMVMEDARLNSVSREIWRKWVPLLLRFLDGRRDELQLQSRLLRRAHELVPDEIVERIVELIDSENERNGHLFVAREMDICWDERLGTALLEKARSPKLHEQILGSILEFLLQRAFPGARELAEARIDTGLYGAEGEQGQAVVAAQVLMRHTPNASWAKIWPILKEKKPIGREIVESVSFGHQNGSNFITKLSESELGELYVWMVENYPYADRKLGFGAMGPSDTAIMLRDGILEHLKKRGTFAACEAIRDVMERLPQYGWMRHHLEEAESQARAATWRPVSIREFLALAFDQDKRFIETGSQLVETIVESLNRLHAKLHGELPAARDLWNSSKEGFWPKDEQDVADYVTRHLNEDLRARGIIVNREVQIRRGTGGGTGQRTDIHVDAVVPGTGGDNFDRIYAIVEVKGNWNAELLSAMETQLRGRYLKDNRCRNGLYLVAWFTCEKWASTDNRKTECCHMSLAEAREFFIRQAQSLSKDGNIIRSYALDVSLL
jgi:hypothetical protein